MTMNIIDALRIINAQVSGHNGNTDLWMALDEIEDLIAAYDALAPKPDEWPDGAQWYAIDADGVATFFDVEPEWDSSGFGARMFEWVIDWRSDPDAPSYPNEPLILDAPKIDVPIGIDWRLCKWQRPEVAA